MTKTTSTDWFQSPIIKEGIRVQGTVIKQNDAWVLVSCADDCFTGIILSKEVRDLEKRWFTFSIGMELEAEIMNTDIRHKEGYYVISISQLLQYDMWKQIASKNDANEIFSVVPTEANLGGLMIDMHGIKWFIPLSQLAPIHYPRVEDGDQEKIFERLLALIGQEFKVRIMTVDQDAKRVVLSEKEALKEERDEVMNTIAVGNEYDGVVSGVSSYGLFVTIWGGVEWLVHISEITYGHVSNFDKLAKIGDKLKVKVIGLEWGKISLSAKQLKPDPWTLIPSQYKIGDVIRGEVVRFVPYGIFVRIHEDINGLIHLSEISSDQSAQQVKLGQVVEAKIILLDPIQRKIGLSIKAVRESQKPVESASTQS
jgi:small subunit ribosomal protein S1